MEDVYGDLGIDLPPAKAPSLPRSPSAPRDPRRRAQSTAAPTEVNAVSKEEPVEQIVIEMVPSSLDLGPQADALEEIIGEESGGKMSEPLEEIEMVP